MVAHAMINGAALALSWSIVVGLLCPSVTSDSAAVRAYNTRSENNRPYFVITKRDSQNDREDSDSKDRRSQMGTSFMRFGRAGYVNNPDKIDYPFVANEIFQPGSRTTRGRSDVILRFGRSDAKNFAVTDNRIATGPRRLRIRDFNELTDVCCNFLATVEANYADDEIVHRSELPRVCRSLGLETRCGTKIFDFLGDAAQDETIKDE